MAVSGNCFQCGEGLVFPDRVGLRDECNRCGADVHTCRNCEHYDEKMYNSCRESQAEKVAEKDRSNRCEHFSLLQKKVTLAPDGKQIDKHLSQKDKLRAQAEALFKNLKSSQSGDT